MHGHLNVRFSLNKIVFQIVKLHVSILYVDLLYTSVEANVRSLLLWNILYTKPEDYPCIVSKYVD